MGMSLTMRAQPPSVDCFPRGLTRKVMATTVHKIMVNSRLSGMALLPPNPARDI